MGFGYLLLGYLIAYVIRLTLGGFGFGGAAVLLGCGILYLGLSELRRYQKAFVYALWMLLPMALCALYSTLGALDALFLWQLPIFGEAVGAVFELLNFLISMLFQLAMLHGIRTIAADVGLGSMSATALRNMLIVAAYSLLMLVGNMGIPFSESVESILALLAMLLNILLVVCNLLLLLACNKNICRKGDEEIAPKRSKFAMINRMTDFFEKNRRETAESTRSYAEDVLRRRRERKNKKRK